MISHRIIIVVCGLIAACVGSSTEGVSQLPDGFEREQYDCGRNCGPGPEETSSRCLQCCTNPYIQKLMKSLADEMTKQGNRCCDCCYVVPVFCDDASRDQPGKNDELDDDVEEEVPVLVPIKKPVPTPEAIPDLEPVEKPEAPRPDKTKEPVIVPPKKTTKEKPRVEKPEAPRPDKTKEPVIIPPKKTTKEKPRVEKPIVPSKKPEIPTDSAPRVPEDKPRNPSGIHEEGEIEINEPGEDSVPPPLPPSKIDQRTPSLRPPVRRCACAPIPVRNRGCTNKKYGISSSKRNQRRRKNTLVTNVIKIYLKNRSCNKRSPINCDVKSKTYEEPKQSPTIIKQPS